MKANFKIKDDILFISFVNGADINYADAVAFRQERVSVLGDKCMPVLIDFTGLRSIVKEARDYYSAEDALKGFTAVALLTNCEFSSFLADYLLKTVLKNVNIPIQLFVDQKEALWWLQQFVK